MALAIAHRLAWPVPEDTRISSPFGPRLHPILKKRIMHRGIDLAVSRGTALRGEKQPTLTSVNTASRRILGIGPNPIALNLIDAQGELACD